MEGLLVVPRLYEMRASHEVWHLEWTGSGCGGERKSGMRERQICRKGRRNGLKRFRGRGQGDEYREGGGR
jgi:hypothetical protein